MYQLLFDGYPIYDPRDEDLVVRNPDVHLAVGEPGSVAFTIGSDHPGVNKLTKLKGTLELLANGRPIFKGRIRKDTQAFDLSRDIEAEGLLACLNDSIIPPYKFPDDWATSSEYQEAAQSGNVVAFFLGWLLEQHNQQTASTQHIHLGEVTVRDPNNYITRASSEYTTTMSEIRAKLTELLGGYLLVDYSGGVPVLNYYEDLPLTNTQDVEFGENLRDLVSVLDATDIYTAILPVGADGLTIGALPDGEISPGYVKQGLIIYSVEAEALYNCRITQRVEWSDVTADTNLQSKALTKLSTDGSRPAHTITARAADLGDAAEEVANFVVGRYVNLKSTPHGLSAVYPLMELDPNIQDPADTVITLGSTVKAASDMAHGIQTATQAAMQQQKLVLDQQFEALTQMLPETTQEQITAALQTAESIVFTALEQYVETANFESFQQTVESEFKLLSDELVIRFTEAISQTQLVDSDLQQTRELLTKHFEFSQNGLTIKAGENTMTLSLDNDMILFEKNGQQFGWWDGTDFHTGNIVIGVTERAQFGSFAFLPRENGLSFMEVGD